MNARVYCLTQHEKYRIYIMTWKTHMILSGLYISVPGWHHSLSNQCFGNDTLFLRYIYYCLHVLNNLILIKTNVYLNHNKCNHSQFCQSSLNS